mmetsp:Transcript_555/g.945  ORF Transcript_555/g.945 Transcript_555/m.945 type:complete len:85 (-) Transcript_555:379-633(-)
MENIKTVALHRVTEREQGASRNVQLPQTSEDSGLHSETDAVWAKSARGVCDGRSFGGELYFTGRARTPCNASRQHRRCREHNVT